MTVQGQFPGEGVPNRGSPTVETTIKPSPITKAHNEAVKHMERMGFPLYMIKVDQDEDFTTVLNGRSYNVVGEVDKHGATLYTGVISTPPPK